MSCKRSNELWSCVMDEKEEGELTDTSRLIDDDDEMMEVETMEEVSSRKRHCDYDISESEKKTSRHRQNSESSISTTSSGNPKKEMEFETDPAVLSRRQKEIDYGKNTIGYDRYIQAVPKYKRTIDHPKTPPKYAKYSRRGWDGMMKIWRKQLHQWDPENSSKQSETNGADEKSKSESNGNSNTDAVKETEPEDDGVALKETEEVAEKGKEESEKKEDNLDEKAEEVEKEKEEIEKDEKPKTEDQSEKDKSEVEKEIEGNVKEVEEKLASSDDLN